MGTGKRGQAQVTFICKTGCEETERDWVLRRFPRTFPPWVTVWWYQLPWQRIYEKERFMGKDDNFWFGHVTVHTRHPKATSKSKREYMGRAHRHVFKIYLTPNFKINLQVS